LHVGSYLLYPEVLMRSFALLLLLCGCAAAGTPEDTASKPSAIFTSAERGTLMTDAPRPTAGTIAATPAAVWIVVKKVYADLEIPLTVDNAAAHQIGNTTFFKMRQMAGRPMPDFVNCGSGVDGPKAATYRVFMSLLTSVSPDGNGGTTIQTTFAASALDIMGGAASDRIQCGSTGQLEYLITDRIQASFHKS
jgi:hypothetical protein